MTDPVCGMTVSPETAAGAWEFEGETFSFCSTNCLERFKQDPGHFLDMDPSDRRM